MGKNTKRTTARKNAKRTTEVKTYKRKATFTVREVKGEKIYTPVNKRAKKYARLVGKRTRVTRDDLKQIANSGKVKIAVYTKPNYQGLRTARV